MTSYDPFATLLILLCILGTGALVAAWVGNRVGAWLRGRRK